MHYMYIAGADPEGGFGGSWPPPALDHQFFFNKQIRSQYSMDDIINPIQEYILPGDINIKLWLR
jgi:hypothetical protein